MGDRIHIRERVTGTFPEIIKWVFESAIQINNFIDTFSTSLNTGDLKTIGGSVPDGWLLCDGSDVSRSVESDLFDVIGTTFGVGDGSTTFGLPNLRSYIIDNTAAVDVSLDNIEKFVISVGRPRVEAEEDVPEQADGRRRLQDHGVFPRFDGAGLPGHGRLVNGDLRGHSGVELVDVVVASYTFSRLTIYLLKLRCTKQP